MKILYGVSGDGLGHSIRSSIILDHLIDRGHEVHVVVSRDGVDYMRERYEDVTEIWGLTAVTEENRLLPTATFLQNLKEARHGLPKNVGKFFEVGRQFDPDVVITDFETWSWFFATLRGKPLLSLDHLMVVPRCEHSAGVLEGVEEEIEAARRVMPMRIPWADRYVISSFFHPEPRHDDTTLVPPVLRPHVYDYEATDGDHLLAYQTSYSDFDFVGALKQLGLPAKVYGLGREIDRDIEDENITLRPFDEEQFIEDLAGSRGVVASAGYNLLSEALHFKKPYFAIPVIDQYEQMLNGRYLDHLGYGVCAFEPTVDKLAEFVDEIPRYRENLEDYEMADNRAVFDHVDRVLEELVAR